MSQLGVKSWVDLTAKPGHTLQLQLLTTSEGVKYTVFMDGKSRWEGAPLYEDEDAAVQAALDVMKVMGDPNSIPIRIVP